MSTAAVLVLTPAEDCAVGGQCEGRVPKQWAQVAQRPGMSAAAKNRASPLRFGRSVRWPGHLPEEMRK